MIDQPRGASQFRRATHVINATKTIVSMHHRSQLYGVSTPCSFVNWY